MSLLLQSPALPLRTDADGIIRVGSTRITLDTIVSVFNRGATAEQIAHDFPVLKLADIYAVIHFYLNDKNKVDDYLTERRRRGEEIQHQLEMRTATDGIRARLMARQLKSEDHNAASGGRKL